MKTLRKIHLYLGCFFAPMIIFFALTGAAQTLGLADRPKSPYAMPAWQSRLADLARAHKNHLSAYQEKDGKTQLAVFSNSKNNQPKIPYTVFVVLMAAGLILTTMLGVMMAFRFGAKTWVVAACLLIGALLPWFLFYLRNAA